MDNDGFPRQHCLPPHSSGPDLISATHFAQDFAQGSQANLKSQIPIKPIFANSPSIPVFAKASAAVLQAERWRSPLVIRLKATRANEWRVEILLHIIRKGQTDLPGNQPDPIPQ
jgi:hypothetical protein